MIRQRWSSRLTDMLCRLSTWQVWLAMVAASLAMTEGIVSAMGLLLVGRVTADYLLTGLVASVLVSGLVSWVILHFAAEVRRLNDDLRLAASVFEHSHDGILITDRDQRILEVNEAFSAITGYGRDEVVGRNPRLLKSDRQGPEFFEAMWQAIVRTGRWYGEIWNRRKDGEVYPELLTISAVRDERGLPSHYVAVFADVTRLRDRERQLEHIAHFDPLTGIPNRALLADRMRQAIARARRGDGLVAVCYLDLDDFKPVNDAHGPDAGDGLLVEMAGRLKACLRGGDTVARLGGDEFVLLMEVDQVEGAQTALKRILAAVAEPAVVAGQVVRVSASIGVALYPVDDADPDTLLRHADQAMYAAKQAGRNRYHLFDAEHDRRARAAREAVERIEQALRDQEFVLHYQPKVNMRLGTVIGAEALIRWRHPDRGLLPPIEFLPLIEDHDLIVAIGDWVIERALTQIEAWRAEGLDLAVSVNVAARQLAQEDFVARLAGQLAAHPAVPAGRLELEVLETAALEDIGGVSRIIAGCRALGVSFALDDFGTGYSSLTYFKRLPAETLKIDQSFIRDMLKDPEDMAIVGGVIGLAEFFRRQVVAEGVETVEHGVLLLNLGCELAQGYGIGRPMPARDFPAWMKHWRPEPAWQATGGSHWHRDDLPLVIAEYDHRRWVDTVAAVAAGQHPQDLPALDPHRCRFGLWYHGVGQARYARYGEFAAISALHDEVHELGGRILSLADQGRHEEARDHLTGLFDLRDRLVGKLRHLLAVVADGS